MFVILMIIGINLGCLSMPAMAGMDHGQHGVRSIDTPTCCNSEPLPIDHLRHHNMMAQSTLVPIASQTISFTILTTSISALMLLMLASTMIGYRSLVLLSLDPPRFSVLRC